MVTPILVILVMFLISLSLMDKVCERYDIFTDNTFLPKLTYGFILATIALIVFGIRAYMLHSNTSDTEWWGDYAVSIHRYEPWDEKVPCRHPVYCSRTVKHGKKRRTERYVCGHVHSFDVDYHPERYEKCFSKASAQSITSGEYYRLLALWGKPFEIELNRHYYTQDGDDIASLWDHNPYTSSVISEEHTYENRVRASNSVFNQEKITEYDINQYHLINYPKCSNYNQDCLIDFVGISNKDSITKMLNYINGYYGVTKQFRCFVIVYNSQPEIVAEKQNAYWENVNKNEFVIMLDLKNGKCDWVKTFSWSDDKMLNVKVESWFRSNEFDLHKFLKKFPELITKHWDRKNFSTFDYIDVDISMGQELILCVVALILGALGYVIVICIGVNQ